MKTLNKNEQTKFRGKKSYGGRTYLPYVYTEQRDFNVISPLLKNEIAVQVSIKIMSAFVGMRKFINANKDLFERIITIENNIDKNFTNIDKRLINYDKKFDIIFNELQRDENFKQKRR